MTIKESVEQLESLIEAWQLDEADLNQTDIDAIKHTLKENKTLKQQLDYLRSSEYYNQLRFERDMLQHVVDHNEVSKEDKEFIDMTHRNTELLEENQQLKENNLAMQEEMARMWAKLEQKEDVIKQLLTYLDKNKLTLNNPNILDFYINVKKILNIEKSDNE